MDMAHPMKKRPGRPPVCEKKRFWGHVLPKASSGCWEWTSAINHNGYGVFTGKGRKFHYAHRFSWELHNSPIPEGLLVCHHCDNRKCVRPDHLFVGTQQDNLDDRGRKGRTYQGEMHHSAKLSADDVINARYMFSSGWRACDLAKKFGVSESSMALALQRKTWKFLP